MNQCGQSPPAALEQAGHDGRRARVTAGFDCGDQLRVCGEHVGGGVVPGKEAPGEVPVRRLERLHEHRVDGIARSERDQMVEGEVEVDDDVDAGVVHRTLALEHRLQRREFLAAPIPGGQACGFGFHQTAQGKDAVEQRRIEVIAVLVDQRREQGEGSFAPVVGDHCSHARPNHDQSPCRQLYQALMDDRPTDAELEGEGALGGQSLSDP